MAITPYIGKDWDAASINAVVDSLPVKLFAQSGNLFTIAWTTNNASVSVDARGNGIRLINHNGTANITLNISRMDQLFEDILNDQETNNDSMHSIKITDSLETFTTDTATLTKIPNITGGTAAPNAPTVFQCMSVQSQAHDNAHFENKPYQANSNE